MFQNPRHHSAKPTSTNGSRKRDRPFPETFKLGVTPSFSSKTTKIFSLSQDAELMFLLQTLREVMFERSMSSIITETT